ncbi:unnamed protein product [Meloidogyne enterolobii]|uniref:Uncharacterized protein n=1 Tax=Meloidogyne enterolobii TaxID=390850 RepID=A0ACB0YUQ7_MELEN
MSSKFIYFPILFLIILNNSWAKWAFLSDQSKCNLNCLNGGVCSFLVKKPEVHKCICLIGMFEGPQCEQAIDQNIQTTTPIYTSLNNEEEEMEDEEEELYEDDETKEEEEKNVREINQNNNPPIYGQTQHFIGPEETNTMSTNLEKFESWHRPLSAVHEENFEELKISTPTKQKFKGNEKTQKEKRKKISKKFPPQPTTTSFPYKEMGGGDGWMVTRRGENSFYSSSSFALRRRNLPLIGGIMIFILFI